jgi:oligo-1,6-glucosidase
VTRPDRTSTSRRQDPWWRDAVVYQVYPRSFADGDGDGIGDLRGLLERIDHLAWLGVDVVWLSPVYPSPQDDNGYDISDHRDVDPVFGTLDDLDAVLAALHDRGMALVLDVVLNHTSDEHPWFAASRSSRDDPKRDWYWWRPPRPSAEPGTAGAEPTDWRSSFSGPAWTFDETTGEYYLHLFSAKQPDLNWENPEVRRACHEVMRFWLDRGVDGFRLDVVNYLSKDPTLPDGVPIPGHAYADPSPHHTSGPRIHEFLHELHREVFVGREPAVLAIGEMPGVTLEEAQRFTDPARRELDMVFQFEHVELDHGRDKWDARPLDLRDLKASLGRWQAGLADRGWNSLYWSNHDQPRAVSRFGDDREGQRVRSATALATVLHLHRGTPFVYQGEELGLPNPTLASVDDLRDIESRNHAAERIAAGDDPETALATIRPMSRDNARTPMPWDGTRHGGFTTGTPWMPLDDRHLTCNVADQVADESSVLHHYRRLIALRHTDPVVVHGDFTMLLADDPQVYAFTRRLEDRELLVLANLSARPARPALPDADGWADAEVVLTNVAEPAPSLALGPWEARVLGRGLDVAAADRTS